MTSAVPPRAASELAGVDPHKDLELRAIGAAAGAGATEFSSPPRGRAARYCQLTFCRSLESIVSEEMRRSPGGFGQP
jgi:hypothetical protein